MELECVLMAEWSFLTNHARVLVCIAHDPGVRLRDIATTLDITERSAYSIVADLTAGGYVVKDKDATGSNLTFRFQKPSPRNARSARCSTSSSSPSLPDHDDEPTGKRDASTPHATDDRTHPATVPTRRVLRAALSATARLLER
jgi:hypothetical protein